MLPAALLFKKAHFFYLCHQSLSADSGSPAEHSVNSAFLPLQRSAKDFIWNSNFLFSLVWTSIISAKQQNTYTLLDFIYFVFYFLTCSIVRLKRHKTVCDTDTQFKRFRVEKAAAPFGSRLKDISFIMQPLSF